MNIYKEAARKGLTFAARGTCDVGDLFRLSLNELDALYRGLQPVAGGLLADGESLASQVVKDVFETLVDERDVAQKKAEQDSKRLRILEIINAKKDEGLASKSIEELEALL